jgi:serine/threonine protein phosphatase PrpC
VPTSGSEVYIVPRTVADEFAVLACDGIWDVMSTDELCGFVRRRLRSGETPEHVAKAVTRACLVRKHQLRLV